MDAFGGHLERLRGDPEKDAPVIRILDELLKNGANLNEFGPERESRLRDCAFCHHVAGVEYLLSRGARTIEPPRTSTALHGVGWIWEYGDARDEDARRIVRALLAAGADPNARDEDGLTPLHKAICSDGLNRVVSELLIQAGADVNAQDDEGETPLLQHYQNRFDNLPTVEFLIPRGANPLIRNNQGETVLDVAERLMQGRNPRWREEQWREQGGPPCGWKAPAQPGDDEYRAYELLKEAARRLA